MQTANAELMRSARESLKGKWGLAIAVSVTYCVLVAILQNIKNIGPIVSLLVSGPFAGGLAIFYLAIARGTEAKFEQLFDGFKLYATYLVAYLLMIIFIFLWSLLLIIPGIVAAISYSMIFFIIADNPSITASDALKRSKAMMNGNKGKYFGLMLRYLGWALLSILTAGIGIIWLVPYMQTAAAKFYDDIKGGNVNDGAPKPVATPTPTAPAPFQEPASEAKSDSEAKDAEVDDSAPAGDDGKK